MRANLGSAASVSALPHLEQEKAKATGQIGRLLAAMDPSIRQDVQQVLTAPCRGKGYTNAKKTRLGSKLMLVQSIHDANMACRADGVPLSGIRSLGEVQALDALVRRVDAGDWAGQTVALIMSGIRIGCRALDGKTPPALKARTSHWVKSARTRHRRQLSAAQYVGGAVEIAAVADFADAAGQVSRARAMRSDAALLAAASDLHGRRGEYAASDLRMTRRTDGNIPMIVFYWDASWRKNKKTRIADVRDPRAVALLDRAIDGRTDGPVFSLHGKAMSGHVVYKSIRRAALLACGVIAGPNSLRDAGASRNTDPVEMGKSIGSSPGVSVKHYRTSMARHGLDLVADALARAAEQGRSATIHTDTGRDQVTCQRRPGPSSDK